MPEPTPFYARTHPLNESHEWRDWSGYLAATLYEPVSHEREYFAIRNSAALIDITPLIKYEVSGPEAGQLIDRIMTRDISRCAVDQVMYSPWCDDAGKVIDDGTISRLGKDEFRLTSAHPNLRWFQDVGSGLDAHVVDVTQNLAALALQGPKSREILQRVVSDIDFETLPYFRLAHGHVDDQPLTVTRTGYTGDLGYELWIRPEDAERVWDRLMATGQDYALLPAGMVALDIARIEAGLILIDVDYISARQALIEAQKSSPFELGLGWAVNLDGADFVGRAALAAEKEQGSTWSFAGLQVAWFELERLFNARGLRPQVAGKRASRMPAPIYKDGNQIGQATSHVFSPLLKQTIAIGTVQAEQSQVGTQVELEMAVEYSRELAQATVVELPFFNPAHKRE
jgi:aminomethyltransferase